MIAGKRSLVDMTQAKVVGPKGSEAWSARRLSDWMESEDGLLISSRCPGVFGTISIFSVLALSRRGIDSSPRPCPLCDLRPIEECLILQRLTSRLPLPPFSLHRTGQSSGNSKSATSAVRQSSTVGSQNRSSTACANKKKQRGNSGWRRVSGIIEAGREPLEDEAGEAVPEVVAWAGEGVPGAQEVGGEGNKETVENGCSRTGQRCMIGRSLDTFLYHEATPVLASFQALLLEGQRSFECEHMHRIAILEVRVMQRRRITLHLMRQRMEFMRVCMCCSVCMLEDGWIDLLLETLPSLLPCVQGSH